MSVFMDSVARLLEKEGKRENWLAEKIGESTSTLNGWKNRKKGEPPVDAALKMARALNTTIEELLGDSYSVKPSFKDKSLDAACDFFYELSEIERYEALAAAMRAVRKEEVRAAMESKEREQA